MDTAALIAVIGTVAGAAIGAGATLASSILSNRAEQRAAELSSRRQTYRSVIRALSAHQEAAQELLEAAAQIVAPDRQELARLLRKAEAAHEGARDPLADLVVDGPHNLYAEARVIDYGLYTAWSGITPWPPFVEPDEHRTFESRKTFQSMAREKIETAKRQMTILAAKISKELEHDFPEIILTEAYRSAGVSEVEDSPSD
ncbi:hypothetical protein [Streptomyces nigra]|uniref:hypothetical protein n=1 Tax=Streptomyces nigra TaxID=1827580 RepID=UPI0035D95C73